MASASTLSQTIHSEAHVQIERGMILLVPRTSVSKVIQIQNHLSRHHVNHAHNLCTGNEATWAWASPCAKNNTTPSKPDAYACGNVEDGRKIQGICPTAAQSTYYEFFVTTSTTAPNTKPTRYTSPPPLDTSKYTVYTETYAATVSAWVQTTTFTTKWESTFTSTLAQSTSAPNSQATGTQGGATGSASAAQVTSLTPDTSRKDKGGIVISPGVLAAAIAGPVVGLAILGWILWYLRSKRKQNRGDAAGSVRLDSSGPENGPVGAAQVNPYEVPATEARSRPPTAHSTAAASVGAAGYYNTEKQQQQQQYPLAHEKSSENIHEMASVQRNGDEKNGFLSPSGTVRETGNASPRSQHSIVSGGGGNGNVGGVLSPISPMSPAPTYHSGNGDAVELDGGGSWNTPPAQQQQVPSRPVGSNRNGVGNA